MKIIVTEYILSPEESAVLLCELKAETEIKVAPVGNMGRSVVDILKEAEFYRQQMKCGRVKW